MTMLTQHDFLSTRADALLMTSNDRLREAIGAIATSVEASMITYNATNEPTTQAWNAASFVMVTVDVAQNIGHSGARFPRREGVVLVGDDLDDSSVWRKAVDIGAEHVVVLPDAARWLEDRLRTAAGPSSNPFCVLCQLPRENVIHDALGFAQQRFEVANKAFDTARKQTGEAALEVLRAMAARENSDVRFIGFNYSQEYFGHGQSGPVVSDAALYDENGKRLTLTTTDANDVVEPTMDDEGMLQAYVNLVAYDLDTDDSAEYALDLVSGAVHTEPPVRLQDPDEDDE